MAEAVMMPNLGEAFAEAKILEWHKKVGDTIVKSDVLCDIETEKAVVEIESPGDGYLIKILAEEGRTVPLSNILAYIGKRNELLPKGIQKNTVSPDSHKKSRKTDMKNHDTVILRTRSTGTNTSGKVTPGTRATRVTTELEENSKNKPAYPCISPRANKLLMDCAIDAATIAGTGPAGRIVTRDVETYLEANDYRNIWITPAAKRLAIHEGINILQLKGSGESRRIMVRDIKRAIEEKPAMMSKMRQAIAKRLTQSCISIPHFFVMRSVDMTDLHTYNKELKKQGDFFSITDFILKSVMLTIKEFPLLNSVTDGTRIKLFSTVNLGIVVALEEGLIIPVLRNSEDMSIRELHKALEMLKKRVHSRKFLPEEISGSTFTVSNMGMFDVENFTAIINPGECAILAISSAMQRATVVDGQIKARSIMKMTLSSDHRIVDGITAAGFMNAIKRKLEDITLWKSLT
jgi:pyruvate dehydrogenase E2 component (dihydrolipoamide acetyltransferase)